MAWQPSRKNEAAWQPIRKNGAAALLHASQAPGEQHGAGSHRLAALKYSQPWFTLRNI